MSKKLINGLKYEKLTEEQLYDLSQWELVDIILAYREDLKAKEQECEELKEGYSELTDIVSPYMDDFTGYNEELGGFDIVLCVKELMEQLDQLKVENKHLNDLLNQALKELEKTRETLTGIKEIAEAESYLSPQSTRLLVHKILQKISECEGNND